MLQDDDPAGIFRIWSNLIGLVAGLAIGHLQMAIDAPFWVLGLSVVVGIGAGELTFRRTLKNETPKISTSKRLRFFVGGLFGGGVSALVSQAAQIYVTSGAVLVCVLAFVLLTIYLGSIAGLGAIIGNVGGIFYWLIPPQNTFAIADANAAMQLFTAMACSALAFGMIWAQRRLKAESRER